MNEQKDDLLAEFENPDISTVQPEPTVENEEVKPTEVAVEPEVTQPIEPEVKEPTEPEATEQVVPPVENVEPVSEEISVDPALEISKDSKDSKDEPTLKKNIIFLVIICILIAAFIIFLPELISLLNNGSY